MTLVYGDVCSGLSAATLAWALLGFEAKFYAEIDPQPCSVLAHRYGASRPMFMPDPLEPGIKPKDARRRRAAIAAVARLPETGRIPNYGDFTQIEAPGSIDLLVGGTPCQDFSIAGLRAGIRVQRGNLTLEFGRLAARARPRWLAWENVPGVLSSHDGRDFASFLGLLSGQHITPPPDGWQSFGVVPGYRNAYGLAWRVLDAQYVRVDGLGRAVPQRRRRVFVVGYLGDWRRAAAVLLERESLSGNPAPRRKAGQGVAPTISARASGGGGLGTNCDGGLVEAALDANVSSPKAGDVCHPLAAGAHVPAIAFHGAGTNISVGHDVAGTLGGGCDRSSSSAPCIAAFTMEARGVPQAVAFKPSHFTSGKDGAPSTIWPPLSADADKGDQDGHNSGNRAWRVRRLTPMECERLQGVPDGHTLVPYGRRMMADGPRYKMLGNSMAVNVMRWLGQRILLVDNLGVM